MVLAASQCQGLGTLRAVLVKGDQVWGPDGVTDIATYPSDSQNYGIYVVLPAAKQILKYSQFGDGSALSPPTNWLTDASDDPGQYLDMTIDFNMYSIVAAAGSCDTACVGDTVVAHLAGHTVSGYHVGALPDDGDLRPGHDYQLITNAGDKSGRLYVYDASHQRVVVFNKTGGTYVEQWQTVAGGTAMADVKGIQVVQPTDTTSTADGPLLADQQGLYASPLVNVSHMPGEPVGQPLADADRPFADAAQTPRRTPWCRTPGAARDGRSGPAGNIRPWSRG